MLLVSETRLEANQQKILHTTNDVGIVFLKFLSDFFRAEQSFKSSIKLVEGIFCETKTNGKAVFEVNIKFTQIYGVSNYLKARQSRPFLQPRGEEHKLSRIS